MEYREGYITNLQEGFIEKYMEKDFPRKWKLATWKGKEDLFTLYELYFEGYPVEILEEGKSDLKAELAWWRELNKTKKGEVTKDKND